MSVIDNIQNIANSVRVSPTEAGAQGLKPFIAIDDGARGDFLRARTRLIRAYRALEALAELANIDTRFKLDLPDARSSPGLSLDLTSTAAALASTEEINASPRSFAPFGPDWDDGSGALITIGGEYDGTHATGPISFEVRRPGTHGINDLRIRVRDPQGNQISSINIRANHDPDRQYSLNNGLFLTLGPGSLINRDTTTIQVFDNVGAAVDLTKPLGGVRNDNPNLQYGLPAIVDGSFLLNSEAINVTTTDTLSDVVNQVNQSNAGVTAIFNPTTERIEFTQDTLGSVPAIDLQNDTSNFLQSTKLDTAAVTPGIDPETVQVFDDVTTFSTVQSGDIVINGKLIAIDTAADSLTAVIDRINGSSAGVTASFDSQSQQLILEAQESASTLDIDSNGTGFFAALNIPEGRVDPEATSSGISRRRSYDIADALESAFAELNYLFRDSSFKEIGADAGHFRVPLESALRGAFGGDEISDKIFGLQFDASVEARRRGELSTLDRRTLTRNLQIRGDNVQEFLAGSDGRGGLINDLLQAARQALTNISGALGQSGTFIDTFV